MSISAHQPLGIYALIGRNEVLPAATLWQRPHVSGLWVNRNWANVEPLQGTYNWADFDAATQAAETHGKPVALCLHQGRVNDGLPSWANWPLFTPSYGTAASLPWTPEFIQRFTDITQRFLDRYAEHPWVISFTPQGYYNWEFDDNALCQRTLADRQGLIAEGFTRQGIVDVMIPMVERHFDTHKFVRIPAGNNMVDETTAAMNVQTSRDWQTAPLWSEFGCDNPHHDARIGFGRTVFSHNTPDPLGIWNQSALQLQFSLLLDYPSRWGQRQPATEDGPVTADDWTKCADIALHYGVQFFEIGRDQANNAALFDVLGQFNQAMLNGGGHIGH